MSSFLLQDSCVDTSQASSSQLTQIPNQAVKTTESVLPVDAAAAVSARFWNSEGAAAAFKASQSGTAPASAFHVRL